MRRLISTGSPFEAELAYSRAVVQGDWCFVAGTTGYDYGAMVMPDSALEQARNALATIGRVLEEAGFGLGDVVRATYYITRPDLAGEISPALRESFGEIRPAGAMLVTGLYRSGDAAGDRGDRVPRVSRARAARVTLASSDGRRKYRRGRPLPAMRGARCAHCPLLFFPPVGGKDCPPGFKTV